MTTRDYVIKRICKPTRGKPAPRCSRCGRALDPMTAVYIKRKCGEELFYHEECFVIIAHGRI